MMKRSRTASTDTTDTTAISIDWFDQVEVITGGIWCSITVHRSRVIKYAIFVLFLYKADDICNLLWAIHIGIYFHLRLFVMQITIPMKNGLRAFVRVAITVIHKMIIIWLTNKNDKNECSWFGDQAWILWRQSHK